ncbi:hypothetical protein ACROYT_G016906 [Oculina patagonica]
MKHTNSEQSVKRFIAVFSQTHLSSFQFQRMSTYLGAKTSSSTKTSTEEASNVGSTVLTAWWVIFSVEAALVIFGNIYAIVFLIRGHFDHVRYFTVSLAFTEIIRGFAALVIVLGLLQSDGLNCRVDYQELHLTLQTLCDVFSLCFLAAISLDMYYRTFWPLTHKLTRVRCYMTTNILIWIVSMVITMTYAFALAGFYQLLIADVAVCSYLAIWKFKRNMDPRIPIDRREQNKKLAMTLFIVSFVSVLTWLSLTVSYTISYTVHGEDSLKKFLHFIEQCFQLANSFVNPIVYYTRMPEFKRSLKNMFLRQISPAELQVQQVRGCQQELT